MCLSMSRIGGAAQIKAMRQPAGTLEWELSKKTNMTKSSRHRGFYCESVESASPGGGNLSYNYRAGFRWLKPGLVSAVRGFSFWIWFVGGEK